MGKKWLTSSEVADMIGVTSQAVRMWAKKGLIPSYRFNRNYRFLEQEIVDWMEQKRKGEVEDAENEIES